MASTMSQTYSQGTVQQSVSTRLKLIAGPDTNGTYVFEDSRGEYRLFMATTTDPSSSVEEILQNGEWVGQWRGSQW